MVFQWFSHQKPPFAAGILPLLTLSDLWDLLDAEADLLGRLVLAGFSGVQGGAPQL
jgi:hypothetical protein